MELETVTSKDRNENGKISENKKLFVSLSFDWQVNSYYRIKPTIEKI